MAPFDHFPDNVYQALRQEGLAACVCVQMQATQAAFNKAQQAQHRAGLEHSHALAASEAQLKTAADEMQVLRAEFLCLCRCSRYKLR